jgi:O-antigen ligase
VSTTGLSRNVWIYVVVLPLALLLGYLLATPYDLRSISIVGLVIVGLSVPIFLRWHHPLLIFAWNANITVFFLPGKPALWMLFAGISLGITVLNCVLEKRLQFQHVPSITWPLMFLLAVVVITAKLTGGIGLRALGSTLYGGKKLVFVMAAVIGYFALSSHRIDLKKVRSLVAAYFLSGLTAVVANLVYLAGPSLYFLFLFFPADNAMTQALDDFVLAPTEARFGRLPGASAAGTALLYFLMARFGLRRLLSNPWGIAASLTLGALSLLGGFRSVVLTLGLLFVVLYYLEGLVRTRLTIVLLIGTVVAGALLVPLASRLPLSIQRSISFLPFDIDPVARANAHASTQWRLDMWEVLLYEVPQYFWLGKGYAINPTDLYFAQESARRGLSLGPEGSIVSGDYHSGPLSILIPFGIFGVLAFLWFIIAGLRLLYRNYKNSSPDTIVINRFLLAYFFAKFVFYVVGFGAFHSDMAFFTGVLGLSVAINGGVQRRVLADEPSTVALPVPA